jgi:muramoyltetrapeptide carboxypeptidase
VNLKPGDEVAIIAPASQLRSADKELLPAAVSLLESWGLRGQLHLEYGNYFYLAGPDSARVAHLHAALTDARVRASFCLRGGYGCPRLFPILNPDINPGQKLMIGYSDMTALHGAVARLWPQIEIVYGPNVATRQFLGQTMANEATRKSLHDLLFVPERPLIEKVEFLHPGIARGNLIGGCLSMFVTLVGTKYDPDTRGAILFLEDVHVPIGFGLRSGHGEVNLSLRLGAPAEIDSGAGTFRMGSR